MQSFVIWILLLFTLGMLPAEAWALCVTTSRANLRAGPGSKHAITWSVPKYTPLIEVKRVGSWYQIEDMDGELHWVYGKNVTTRMVCVSVKVASAKLRKAPGGDPASIPDVDRYTPFQRVDIQGEWYEVVASWGESYWIHESTVWRPVRISKVQF